MKRRPTRLERSQPTGTVPTVAAIGAHITTQGPEGSATEPSKTAKGRSGWLGPLYSLQHVLHKHASLGPLLVLVLSAVVFELLHAGFLHLENISLMLEQLAVLDTLSIGQTMIMLTAGIDLSVGALMILAQMIMGELAINAGVSPVLALVIGVRRLEPSWAL